VLKNDAAIGTRYRRHCRAVIAPITQVPPGQAENFESAGANLFQALFTCTCPRETRVLLVRTSVQYTIPYKRRRAPGSSPLCPTGVRGKAHARDSCHPHRFRRADTTQRGRAVRRGWYARIASAGRAFRSRTRRIRRPTRDRRRAKRSKVVNAILQRVHDPVARCSRSRFVDVSINARQRCFNGRRARSPLENLTPRTRQRNARRVSLGGEIAPRHTRRGRRGSGRYSCSSCAPDRIGTRLRYRGVFLFRTRTVDVRHGKQKRNVFIVQEKAYG
jgi:hypothetical protein